MHQLQLIMMQLGVYQVELLRWEKVCVCGENRRITLQGNTGSGRLLNIVTLKDEIV